MTDLDKHDEDYKWEKTSPGIYGEDEKTGEVTNSDQIAGGESTFILSKRCRVMDRFVERRLDVQDMMTDPDYRFLETVRCGKLIRQSADCRARTQMANTDGRTGQFVVRRGDA